MRNGVLGVGSVAALAVLAVAGLLPGHAPASATSADALSAGAPTKSSPAPTPAAERAAPKAAPAPGLAQLPGLGAAFRAKIPADSQQVLVATGRAANTNTVTVVLYTRTAQGTWLPGQAWAGHNALDGWTTEHYEGDLHSPIGVYTLTDAGGLYANPGTKFPYLRSSEFQDLGTGFEGESLADAFNYVIAINYNHVPGTSPLSNARPMGETRGGGIWIHVDHGGPTHGCISLPQADVVTLLRTLDPAKHPVIVMGNAAALSA
nr:L,D-transpeptidase family protein [Streptacidiphilus sp. P02-A3a]